MAVATALLAWQLTSPDPRIGDDDFQVFYPGAAAIAAGLSPYVGDFVSPPWFALALVPLTRLPLEIARGAWLALNVALLLATTAASARLVALSWPARRIILAALLFALWQPIEFGLRLGQNSLLVWALVLAASLGVRAAHFGRAGSLLALALIKPQLVLLFAGGIAVRAARQRQLARFAGASLGTLAVLVLLVLFVAPDAYADLLALRPRTWNYWGSTVALPPLLAALFGSERLAVVAYLPMALVGSVAVLWVWARADMSDLAYVAALTAAATLLLTPYAYPYDAVLLQLPILWLLAMASRVPHSDRRRMVSVALLSVLALWLLERPGDYTVWRFLGLLPPLGTLIAIVAVRWVYVPNHELEP